MRSLAPPHDPSEALAGLWRGPRPENDPVEKTLADSDRSPLREATRNPYLVAWLPSWVRRQGDFLTAMTPNPREPLHHPLLKSHFSPHEQTDSLSTHTSEAHCCKVRGASLGCTVWTDGEGVGGLSASQSFRVLPLHSASYRILPRLLKSKPSTMPGLCQAPSTWKRRWNLFQGIL